MSILDRLDLPSIGHRVLTDTPPEPVEVAALVGISRSGALSGVVDRLLAVVEQDEGGSRCGGPSAVQRSRRRD